MWIIYKFNDPILIGQRGRVQKSVYGKYETENEAIQAYNEYKSYKRVAGLNCEYISYPTQE